MPEGRPGAAFIPMGPRLNAWRASGIPNPLRGKGV
jgi:hypothetical protein